MAYTTTDIALGTNRDARPRYPRRACSQRRRSSSGKRKTKPTGNPRAKRLDIHGFHILRTLGCGSFGRVKLAKSKEADKKGDHQYVAIKYMRKYDIIKTRQVDHVNAEKELMGAISHPFIVNMVGYWDDQYFLYIHMEAVFGGELFTHLRKNRRFTGTQAKFYAAQMTQAFDYLHTRNIVHRDLKPENILVAANGYAKLTDFGFAKVVPPGERTYTVCGTPEYIAPEVILSRGHGKAVDWWCLGILTYEMLVGQPPFIEEQPQLIYQRILTGKVYFPRFFDNRAKPLVKCLLTADLSRRYGNLKNGAADIINSTWLKNVDWHRLLTRETYAPLIPKMSNPHDLSNFDQVPDSSDPPPAIDPATDPFKEWS